MPPRLCLRKGCPGGPSARRPLPRLQTELRATVGSYSILSIVGISETAGMRVCLRVPTRSMFMHPSMFMCKHTQGFIYKLICWSHCDPLSPMVFEVRAQGRRPFLSCLTVPERLAVMY